jgi:riboflavin synthase
VAPDSFVVALIPTTLSHTTLGLREPGDTVNLEADVVAKYVERLAAGYVGGDRPAAAVTVGKEVRAR